MRQNFTRRNRISYTRKTKMGQKWSQVTQTRDTDLLKDIIKIWLHDYTWELKTNYPREEENMKCPICNKKEEITEHVLECQTAETLYRIRDNTPNHWAEVVKLYRQNKELRK